MKQMIMQRTGYLTNLTDDRDCGSVLGLFKPVEMNNNCRCG